MNNVSEIVQKVREQFTVLRRRRAIARARQKADDERLSAAIELVMDDLVAEGLTPGTPEFNAAFLEVLAERARKHGVKTAGYNSPLEEGWPEGW